METVWKASPKTFIASHGASIGLIVPVSFAGLAYLYRHPADVLAGLFLGLIAILAVLLGLQVWFGFPQLIVDNEGFTIRNLLSKRVHYWSDGYEFEVRERNGMKLIAYRQSGSDCEELINTTRYRDNAETILGVLTELGKTRAVVA